MANEQKKLMSVMVRFYNQVQYVERCLKSVLAQTYSPLEIVVVDDCSSDGSFELAQKIADEYVKTDGKHVISVYQNEINSERVRTFERAFGLCHGELVFNVDGDDMCHPRRVETVVKAWEADGSRASVIWSACYLIDDKDRVLGTLGAGAAEIDGVPMQFGAVNVWRRSALLGFPKIDIDRRSVDDILYVRRALMNKDARTLVLSDRLVFYRLVGITYGGKGKWLKSKLVNMDRGTNTINYLEQEFRSVARKRGMSDAACQKFASWLQSKREEMAVNLKKYAGATFGERLEGFKRKRYSWRSAYFWLVDLPLLGPKWFANWTTAIYGKYITLFKRLRTRSLTVDSILNQ